MANTLAEDYTPEREQAVIEGVSLRTLRRRRARREGPPWVRLNSKIYYSKAGFKEWLDAHTVHPLDEAA